METVLQQKAILNAEQQLDAEQGWNLYKAMKAEWFKAGVNDAAIGKAPQQPWNKVYMTGYSVRQFVAAEVEKMML